MYHTPTIMIDFETTGMSPGDGARITEVAALRIVDGRIVDRFVSLVNCGVEVPPFITSLTGITQQMVDTAPRAEIIVPELISFIGEDALAAHNASFDVKFLQAESARVGLRPLHRHLLCSVKLARRVLPGLPSYSLGKLARSLGIRFNGNAHRAEADAEVSAQLMLHIGERLRTDYRIDQIDAAMLAHITQLTSARVPSYLSTLGTTRTSC